VKETEVQKKEPEPCDDGQKRERRSEGTNEKDRDIQKEGEMGKRLRKVSITKSCPLDIASESIVVEKGRQRSTDGHKEKSKQRAQSKSSRTERSDFVLVLIPHVFVVAHFVRCVAATPEVHGDTAHFYDRFAMLHALLQAMFYRLKLSTRGLQRLPAAHAHAVDEALVLWVRGFANTAVEWESNARTFTLNLPGSSGRGGASGTGAWRSDTGTRKKRTLSVNAVESMLVTPRSTRFHRRPTVVSSSSHHRHRYFRVSSGRALHGKTIAAGGGGGEGSGGGGGSGGKGGGGTEGASDRRLRRLSASSNLTSRILSNFSTSSASKTASYEE